MYHFRYTQVSFENFAKYAFFNYYKLYVRLFLDIDENVKKMINCQKIGENFVSSVICLILNSI